MKVNAGQLNRRIVIKYNAEGAKNSFGEPVMTETVLLTTYAKLVEQMSSNDTERYTNDTQIVTSDQVQFLIRWTPLSITPKMWIEFEGIKYLINKHPSELGFHQYFLLTTERKDNV
jgi:head-tail adaptor